MEFTRNERLIALHYSTYMIASSYFHSARCLDRGREDRGHLFYQLMGTKEQYRMEDALIRMMETSILPLLPEAFQSADVTVRILPGNDGILLMGLGYELRIQGTDPGRTLRFRCTFRDLMEQADPQIRLEYPPRRRTLPTDRYGKRMQ